MKKVTQADIAKISDLDQGSVSRILNKDTRDSFAPETVARVFKIARELGYLHPALVQTNRRESQRRKTSVPVRVAIMIGTNTVYDEGGGMISEISQSGCVIRSIDTKKKNLPMDRFRFDIDVKDGRLRGFRSRCRVVRFSPGDDTFGLALAFEPLSADKKDMLRTFLK